MAKTALRKKSPVEATERKEPKRKPIALTNEEAALVARSETAQSDWRSIKESDVDDFSAIGDPFAIPEPAKLRKDNKEFAFRWITRSPASIDLFRTLPVPRRWWLCTRTETPWLEESIDPILGLVCKLDQCLVFKPYWMFAKEQDIKQGMAKAQDRAADLGSKVGIEKGGGTLVSAKETSRDIVVAENIDDDKRIGDPTPEGGGFDEEE